MLGVDSAAVIAARTIKMAAGGPAADAEAHLMMSEKLIAATKLHIRAMSGALGWSVPGAAIKTIAHNH